MKPHVSMEKLSAQADILHLFVKLLLDYEHYCQDDMPDEIPAMALNVLYAIEETPGITGVQLADRFLCTASAISQNLKWLEQRGYIYRKLQGGQGQRKRNHLTDSGLAICENYRYARDAWLGDVHDRLLDDCSQEDINTFYRVMQVYSNIVMDERRHWLMRQEMAAARANESEEE